MGNDASKSGKSGFGFKGMKVPAFGPSQTPDSGPPMPPHVDNTDDELTLTQHSDRQIMSRGIVGKPATAPIIIQTKNNTVDDELTLTEHEQPTMRRILTQEVDLATMLGVTPPGNQSTLTMKVRLVKELAAENVIGMRRVLTVESFGSYGSYDGVSIESKASTDHLLIDTIELAGFSPASFAGRTKKGYTASNPKKPNQDSFLMQYDPCTSSLVMACFDGHGQFGHDVSTYCKNYFESKFVSHAYFTNNLHRAIYETIDALEREMLAAPEIDTVFSGTTLTMIIVRGMKVTVVNVGDSRAIAGVQLMSQVGSPIKVMPLSVDHKPELPAEEARICSSGGRVKMIHGCGRVYLATEEVPGLAMSRSLGDFVAHNAGVSSEPDVWDYNIGDLLAVCGGPGAGAVRLTLMVATDGVFDMLSNEDAVVAAMNHWDQPGLAIDDIMTVTERMWRAKWNLVDDTSVCIVNIDHNI